MENFVDQAAAAMAKALDHVDPIVAFAVCAALSVVALAAQLFAARRASAVVGDCRRVKRFVVKRGEVVSSNAHRFYKKCVRRMGRRVRRAWKKHALCGREYAGSALQFEVDRYLGRERRAASVYLPCAVAAVALLQTVLLCKGMDRIVAVAYTFGAAAVWAALALPAAAYCSYRRRSAAVAASKLSQIIRAKVTLRPAEGRLFVLPTEMGKAEVVAPAAGRTLADAVGEYLAAAPDKEVAKVVSEGIEKAGVYGCKSAEQASALTEARDKLKKYTA